MNIYTIQLTPEEKTKFIAWLRERARVEVHAAELGRRFSIPIPEIIEHDGKASAMVLIADYMDTGDI